MLWDRRWAVSWAPLFYLCQLHLVSISEPVLHIGNLHALLTYICISLSILPFQTHWHKRFGMETNVSKVIISSILSWSLQVHIFYLKMDKNKISWVEKNLLVNKVAFKLHTGIYVYNRKWWPDQPLTLKFHLSKSWSSLR